MATEEERLEFGSLIRKKMAEALMELEKDPHCFDHLSDDVIAVAPIDEQIDQMKKNKNLVEN